MWRQRGLLAGVMASAVIACGGGGGDGGTDGDGTGPPDYSLEIFLSAPGASVQVGSTVTITITIKRGGGFTGPVTLSAQGIPSTVTYECSPYELSGSATTSTMTLTVGAGAAFGSYPVSIHATAAGVTEPSAPFALTVIGYSVVPLSTSLTIAQGSTAHLGVTITRGGVIDPVTLALEGAPAGVTGIFDPSPVTGTAADLALSVGTAVSAGDYTLTIRGTVTGLAARTATITLTVRAADVAGFTLALAPSSLTVAAGSEATAVVTIQRSGGYSAPVSLFLEAYPTGSTPTFSPSSTTGSTSTLTLSIGAGVAAGTYTLAVSGHGQSTGDPVQRVFFQLTVTAVSGYTIRGPTTPITIVAGGASQSFNVTIDRTGGFTGEVSLSMTGFPASVTTTFNPVTTTGSSSTGLITVPPGVTAGNYTGTIHGTAVGLAERTTTVTVSVAISGTSIVWRFCAPNTAPVFFAYQDGASPFTAVSPAGDGSYTISIGSGKGAVVMVQPGLPEDSSINVVNLRRARRGPVRTSRLANQLGGYTTFVRMATTSELQALAQAQCPGLPLRKTVSGSVSGVTSDEVFIVGMGGGLTLGIPDFGTSFSLEDVLDGPRDLVAARATLVGDAGYANKIIIRRDVNAPNGSVLPVLDFGSAEAFDPVTAMLTLSGIPAGAMASVGTSFTTANGTAALFSASELSTATARTAYGVPTTRLRAGDLHAMTATTEPANPNHEQSVTLFASGVAPQSVAFVAELPDPAVSLFSTSPVPRMRATGSLGSTGSPFGSFIEVSFVQDGADRAWVMSQTRGWIGTTANYDIRTIVLSGVTGWNESAYGVQTGSTVHWTVETRSAGDEFVPAAGALYRTLMFHGEVLP
jgi:uncharacterized membrane protein